MYLLAQSTIALTTGHRAQHSLAGIIWTAVTALVMFALAAGKTRTGRALNNPVLATEGRVTFIDGILAVAVLAAVVLNVTLGWWEADPVAGLVIVYYALREAHHIFTTERHVVANIDRVVAGLLILWMVTAALLWQAQRNQPDRTSSRDALRLSKSSGRLYRNYLARSDADDQGFAGGFHHFGGECCRGG